MNLKRSKEKTYLNIALEQAIDIAWNIHISFKIGWAVFFRFTMNPKLYLDIYYGHFHLKLPSNVFNRLDKKIK